MNTSSPIRNVEQIRRSNLEDNQIFLRSLLLRDIQNELLESTRSLRRANQSCETSKKAKDEKHEFEYMTRYQEKVKSGEIVPRLPEAKPSLAAKKKKNEEEVAYLRDKHGKDLSLRELRSLDRQLRQAEEEKMRRVQERTERYYRWKSFFMNGNPYERVFQPRRASVHQRMRQQDL